MGWAGNGTSSSKPGCIWGKTRMQQWHGRTKGGNTCRAICRLQRVGGGEATSALTGLPPPFAKTSQDGAGRPSLSGRSCRGFDVPNLAWGTQWFPRAAAAQAPHPWWLARVRGAWRKALDSKTVLLHTEAEGLQAWGPPEHGGTSSRCCLLSAFNLGTRGNSGGGGKRKLKNRATSILLIPPHSRAALHSRCCPFSWAREVGRLKGWRGEPQMHLQSVFLLH